MSYIGIPPFGQTVRSVTTATATSGQTTFNISGGYVVGYVDVYLNGLLLAPTAYTATDGLTVVLGTGATAGDKFQALSYQPVSLVDALKASNNLSEVASASTARTNLGLGSIATQSSSNVSISGGSITGITDLGVADGGTGASTLTGYVKGSGTSPFTASSTIPNTDITGLGTISTQDANNVSISGGSITGITDLAVADGGTGASSLTANNVILGNGTSPVQFVAPGTAGNVLTSDGTTWASTAPGGGGGSWTPVLSGAISGTPTNITSFPTGEGTYMLVCQWGWASTAAEQVWSIRVSFDGGSTYVATANSYWDPVNAVAATSYPFCRLFPSTSQTTRGATYLLITQSTLGGIPMVTMNPGSVNTAAATVGSIFNTGSGGYRLGTSPCNAIQLIRTIGTLNPVAGSRYVVYKMGAWS